LYIAPYVSGRRSRLGRIGAFEDGFIKDWAGAEARREPGAPT
jgi:hypothetical protein